MFNNFLNMRTTSFLLLFLMCFSLSARKKSKQNIQVEVEIIQIVEPAVMEPVVLELGMKDTISATAIMVPDALALASDELLREWFVQNHTFTDTIGLRHVIL